MWRNFVAPFLFVLLPVAMADGASSVVSCAIASSRPRRPKASSLLPICGRVRSQLSVDHYLGYAKVRALYDEARKTEGDQFNLQSFMDGMMKLGPVKLEHYRVTTL